MKNVTPTLPWGSSVAPPIPADQRVRDRIRTDLGTTLIIEAAAGTGKTTALVSRIIAVLTAGLTTLDRIVAVTFTEKAAGELKLRLRSEIERVRNETGADSVKLHRLDLALEKLEEARIGTIHAFCADLLRERPVEARVDPMFEVAPDDVASNLFDAAFDRWFEQALANPGEGVRRILRRRDLADRNGPRPLLQAAARELLEWRDFGAPWQPAPFGRDRAIDHLIDGAAALLNLSAEGEADDWLRRSIEEIWRPIGEAIRLESVRPRDYDALEDTLQRLLRGNQRHWNWRGRGDFFGELRRSDVIARRDAFHASLEQFSELSGANLAPLLRSDLLPILDHYRDLKYRGGRLDFLDLLLIARDLVRGNPLLRADLQDRFSHIFIDEFQDTDPLQAEILMLLAADDPAQSDWLAARPVPGKLFIVGDPKQSIYRFRRADVALYQAIKRHLLDHGGAALERLTVSFRATPAIQSMVNAAFAPLMATETPTQPSYAALEPYREDLPSQPAIIALPVPNPYGDYGRITNWRIDESLPDAVGAFVRWIVEDSGWTVTEREKPNERVPIRPRHICILFRRFSSYGRDVTRGYVRALEARHIAHVLVRGGSFHEREEVEAIRNAMAAIERPDDTLAVFATLRGPLFAISDGALLEIREIYKTLHPFFPFPQSGPKVLPGHLRHVADALAVLRDLHRGRNRRPIADTIARLLAATRAHAGIAIWPTGDQALANVMRLMDLARRYESNGGAASLRGFVEDLETRAENEMAGEAPVVEEGTEGVRIMTVHRAKGLEFPAVILADITCNETAGDARRFVDPARRLCALRLANCAPRELLDHAEEELRRDEEEAVRLLYVAATRARDLIVAPVVGDEPQSGWLSRLTPVLYPDLTEYQPAADPHPPGCPPFKSKIVGKRPDNANTRAPGLAPGGYQPAAGTHCVVWWDPEILDLDTRETMGLRQTRLLEADAAKVRSEQGAQDYLAWRARRDDLIAAGSAPSLRLATATELALAEPRIELPEAAAIQIEQTHRAPDRPRGNRFGTLVHAIMSRIPFDASQDAIADSAALYGRIVGATPKEAAAATGAVLAALNSPLILRARNARELRRESPLIATLGDGLMVEGVADLAFLEESDAGRRWVVVDFKTDADVTPRLTEYRTQVALYLRALTRATNLPAIGLILWL
ncbi:MAG: UvrD-helicase domain-containing protein [Candidatus Binataceae bacterium]